MSHHCTSGSCSCGSTHSHGKSACSCCEGCKCGCHKEHKGSYAHELLQLADAAWMEVLKEKIKNEIIQHSGDHLNKMAKLVAEANHKQWTEKLAEKRSEREFEDRLQDML